MQSFFACLWLSIARYGDLERNLLLVAVPLVSVVSVFVFKARALSNYCSLHRLSILR